MYYLLWNNLNVPIHNVFVLRSNASIIITVVTWCISSLDDGHNIIFVIRFIRSLQSSHLFLTFIDARAGWVYPNAWIVVCLFRADSGALANSDVFVELSIELFASYFIAIIILLSSLNAVFLTQISPPPPATLPRPPPPPFISRHTPVARHNCAHFHNQKQNYSEWYVIVRLYNRTGYGRKRSRG